MKEIRSISNIKLHYARTSQFPYGSIGQSHSFWIDEGFYNKLIVCFDEVFDHCPLKKPEVITCAGIYVNKSNSKHKQGKAFDFDAAFWKKFRFITRNFYEDYELYIGIESFLRKHFGIVLSYFYNNDHRDHFHINTGATMGFDKRQRSKVLYLQMSLKYIYKYDIEVDGAYGSQTEKYFRDAFKRLKIPNKLTKQNWYMFLTKTGLISFRKFREKHSARRNFEVLHSRISDLEIASEDKFQLINTLNNLEFEFDSRKVFEESNPNEELDKLINDVNSEIK